MENENNNSNKRRIFLWVFGASWCGNCRRLEPIMKKVIEVGSNTPDYDFEIVPEKCLHWDTEEGIGMQYADQLEVGMLPTVFVFDSDTTDKLGSFTGLKSYGWIMKWLEEVTSK